MKSVDYLGRPDAFWKKVECRDRSECWRWSGALNRWGYGAAAYDGKQSNASRVAWLLVHGEIPSGMVVCHRCDNPACCNPAHLFLGTQADNLRDCRQKKRAKGAPEGAAHHRSTAKLTADQVAAARGMFERGVSQTDIAQQFGVHSSTISRAVRGKRWRHLEAMR